MTLNYVVAQTIGAMIGIVLLGILRSPLAQVSLGLGRLESLRVILGVYTALLIGFLLTPLDFALNVEDMTAQLDKLPGTFTDFIGEGRPWEVRSALIVATIMETIPVGALLTLLNKGRIHVGRSAAASGWIGFVLMLVVYAASTMSDQRRHRSPPSPFRTLGVILGAWLMHWLDTAQTQNVKRYDLEPISMPWRRCRSTCWRVCARQRPAVVGLEHAAQAAYGDFYNLGLLPGFNYYIVSKAQAAKNIVGHVAMYAHRSAFWSGCAVAEWRRPGSGVPVCRGCCRQSSK